MTRGWRVGTIRMALRVVAVLIAVAGVIDPAFAVPRLRPVPVEFRIHATPSAAAARDRLRASLADAVVVDSGAPPAAVVLIGDAEVPSPLPPGVPVSLVSLVTPGAPNVRLLEAPAPAAVLPGQQAVFPAVFEATGLAGRSSAIELIQDGATLAHVDHTWTRDDERFTADLRYAPPDAGLSIVSVAAQPIAEEASADDNAADVALVATARPLRIAVYEPRPSWTAGFVRRVLEADPVFAVSSLVRPSRGLEVRAGTPPRGVNATSLAPFDAVLVGAPEELTEPEAAALDAFARGRGGAVVLLSDRRPSGPCLRLIPAGGFDEALLDTPLVLEAERGAGLTASELALPRRVESGGVALASVTLKGAPRGAIVSWPQGSGRMVFSGALDAWRFRARNDDAFARFWTGTVASLAAGAAPRLSLSVTPAAAGPGDLLTIRAALRRSEISIEGARMVTPAIEAALVATDGTRDVVRLWPAAQPGLFEGTIGAPAAGRYDVRVSAGGGATADAPLVVASGMRHPPAHDGDAIRQLTRASGGVVTDASNLLPLETHLRRLPRRSTEASAHPMRSAWWSLAFAAALCGEWALGRRGGAR